MITQDRALHMLGVANRCYTLTKEKYKLSEDKARECFILGWLHDVGYQFAEESSKHPQVGYNLLRETLGVNIQAILNHGKPSVPQDTYLIILNETDLTVNSKGEQVTVQERLEDIRSRYGDISFEYLTTRLLTGQLCLLNNSKGE